MSKPSGGPKPLGVKQLLGRAGSRLPTFQRRETMRQAGTNRQASSRERIMNKNRNLNIAEPDGQSHKETEGNKRQEFTNDSERKREMLRRLEEFKAQKKRSRLEEIRARRKPFVVGISNTPSQLPKTPTRTAGSSMLFTPKRVPFYGSSHPSQSGIPVKRQAVTMSNGGSKLPVPGLQRAKPNLASKDDSSKKAVQAPVVAQASATSTSKKEEKNMDNRSLNDTYEIVQNSTDEGGLNVVASAEEHGDEGICNVTLTIATPGEEFVALGVDALVSIKTSEGSDEQLIGATWNPAATSSPERGGQARARNGAWYDGLDHLFTFDLANDDSVSSKIPDPRDTAEESTERRDDEEETKVWKLGFNPVSQDAADEKRSPAPEKECVRQPVSNAEGASRDAVQQDYPAGTTPETASFNSSLLGVANVVAANLRRSTRSTRFTGSFKGQLSNTPRSRRSSGGSTKISSKAAQTPLTALVYDEDGNVTPGIMEVRTPDSLVPMNSSSESLDCGIEDDLAGLNLSSSSIVRSQRQSVATWTSIEVSDDDDDEFATAPLQLSIRQNKEPNRTLDESELMSSLREAAPEVVFNAPPETPSSILRKDVGASAQKKRVRFRHNVSGSPIRVLCNNPAATATPATDVLSSFARRQSVMPKANSGEDLMSWSP